MTPLKTIFAKPQAAFGSAVGALAISASLALPTLAHAECQLEHVLDYKMTGGVAVISVNDIVYQKLEGPRENWLNFISWIQVGENSVQIDYRGDGSATVQLKAGCVGSFDADPVSEPVHLSAGASARFLFAKADGADGLLATLNPSDDAGLAEAYADFRKAVLSRDFQTVLEVIEPFVAHAERQGFPREMFVENMARALKLGEFKTDTESTFFPAAGGRVYQRLRGGSDPAIVATFSDDGATWTVPFGTYWSKVDGQWRVVHN